MIIEKGRIMICGILALAQCSCSFGDEPSLCPFNTRLEYWYAGSSAENILPVYVDNIRQYLFDGEGKLIGTTTLRGDSVTGWSADLPEGSYTIVLWGNPGEEAKSSVQAIADGEDRLGSMVLSAGRDSVPPCFRENTERLYYGTASFEVDNKATRRQRIYLSHAHAALSVTVHWMEDAPPPPEGGTYRMRLKGTPDIYEFVSGYDSDTPSGNGIFHIPRIGGTVTYHETRAAMNYEGEVTGQLITYRYTSHTHQLWSLWRNGEQIIRDLDLNSFFSKLPMNMDTNIEQEFDILVTVYKDKIVVSLASASDWDEGGTLG